MARHHLTRDDIIPMEDYTRERKDRRRAIAALKKDRRIAIGPDATAYFENYDTMWYQVHEMLFIEHGGEAQIADELSAYNPLIPNGRELVTTLMFEIDDESRRDRVLSRLGNVEATVTLGVGGETIAARPEDDVARTSVAGKASSVHFLHFPFTDEQVETFRAPAARVVLGIGHESYGHMAILPASMIAALAEDFD